jgi:hypothetical protein
LPDCPEATIMIEHSATGTDKNAPFKVGILLLSINHAPKSCRAVQEYVPRIRRKASPHSAFFAQRNPMSGAEKRAGMEVHS